MSLSTQTSGKIDNAQGADNDGNSSALPIETLLNQYEKHSGRNTPNTPSSTGPLDVLEDDLPPLIPDPSPAPSSSGKESAAARMARIVAASSPDVDLDTPIQGEEAITPKRVRPLAARRKLVSQKAPESSNSINGDDSAEAEKLSLDTNAPSSKAEKSSGDQIHFTPKTVKEIEAEVAKNTKAFDDKVLKKEVDSANDKLALAKRRRLKVDQNPLTTGGILQVIRLIAIIILAVHTGYTTVTFNGVDDVVVLSKHYSKIHNRNVNKFKSSTATFDRLLSYFYKTGSDSRVNGIVEVAIDKDGNAGAVDPAAESIFSDDAALSADVAQSAGVIGNIGASSSGTTSTWGDWFRKQIRGQVECTFAAVSLIWWASGSLYPVIDSFVIKNKAKSEGILQKLLAIYSKGFEALIEPLLSTTGELALHFSILILTHTVVQLVHAEKGSGALFTAHKEEL